MADLSGLTVNINVTSMEPFAQFFDRLQSIADDAPPDTRAKIEAAFEDMLRAIGAPRTPRYETKGPT